MWHGSLITARYALQLGQTIIFVRTRATAHNLHRAVSFCFAHAAEYQLRVQGYSKNNTFSVHPHTMR